MREKESEVKRNQNILLHNESIVMITIDFIALCKCVFERIMSSSAITQFHYI